MRCACISAVIAVLVGANPSSRAADNVILFIGDGMGWSHVKAGRVLVNGSSDIPLSFEKVGYTAEAVTTLPNGSITDSATAATAMATGYQHPANGVISMGQDQSIKTTILEWAKAKGFRTGIITTDDIGGATPGAFGAHEPNRAFMADIRYDYFVYDATYGHPASLPDVLLGGGYDDPAPVPGTSLTLVQLARSLGYSFVNTPTGLAAAADGPLLGLFGTYWAPLIPVAYLPTGQPRLSQMVAKALTILENPRGLFLIVEGANIDKLSHSQDSSFVWEVAELDAAVQAAISWGALHPGDNTMILVTADHETGGLSVPEQISSPGEIPNMIWSTTGHTAGNVPVFATWPASLNGLTVDNTEIFFLLEDYLSYSSGGKPPEITGMTVSGITETGATVQWHTQEPSDTALYFGPHLLRGNAARVNRHAVVCSGLSPGRAYQFTAVSRDLAGYSMSTTVAFQTKAPAAGSRSRPAAQPQSRYRRYYQPL